MSNNQRTQPMIQEAQLLEQLKARFEKNMQRHQGIEWGDVVIKLKENPHKLWSVSEMERTGGEPDILLDTHMDTPMFVDCSAESPSGRRSICYDGTARIQRKKNKPLSSAIEMAENMGIEILCEDTYRLLQKLGHFDTKTSSWIKTPASIRRLGGALFCDRRYDTIFVYHNGAESYYASRGFRGFVKI